MGQAFVPIVLEESLASIDSTLFNSQLRYRLLTFNDNIFRHFQSNLFIQKSIKSHFLLAVCMISGVEPDPKSLALLLL